MQFGMWRLFLTLNFHFCYCEFPYFRITSSLWRPFFDAGFPFLFLCGISEFPNYFVSLMPTTHSADHPPFFDADHRPFPILRWWSLTAVLQLSIGPTSFASPWEWSCSVAMITQDTVLPSIVLNPNLATCFSLVEDSSWVSVGSRTFLEDSKTSIPMPHPAILISLSHVHSCP